VQPKSTPRQPRWYLVPLRVVLVTFIGTLISFAVSLLLGIVGTIAISWWRGARPNMTIAYRVFALPAALVAGSVILVLALTLEVRHYRQTKTLAAIERAS
jgi:hypothetical protein